MKPIYVMTNKEFADYLAKLDCAIAEMKVFVRDLKKTNETMENDLLIDEAERIVR